MNNHLVSVGHVKSYGGITVRFEPINAPVVDAIQTVESFHYECRIRTTTGEYGIYG